MDRDASLSPGSMLGPYRVVRRVGRGTFSEVYEALKQPLNRRVALKIMHAEYAAQPEAIARFEREARVAASVDHPHVVKVIETGYVDHLPVHEMEFLDGPTLSAAMRAYGPFSAQAACDIAVPLISAVASLHDLGFVHRDLKPSNVILAARARGVQEAVLIDLGIVKAPDGPTDSSLTRTSALLGSPGYMSPEQARESRSLDARSDQFSLAVILWELLQGQRLFEGDVLYKVLQKVAEAPITPPIELRPELPRELSDALMRALDRDAAQRFASIRELGVALLPFASPGVRARFAGEFEPPQLTGPVSFAELEESTLVSPRNLGMSSGTLLGLPAAQAPAPLAILPAPIVSDSLPSVGASTLPPALLSQETLSPQNLPRAPEPHALPLSRGAAIGFGALFVVGAVALFGGTPDEAEVSVAPPVTLYRVDLRVIPPEATILLDGSEVGRGHFVTELPRDGRAHRLRAQAPGYVPREVEFTDAPPPAGLTLVPSAPMGREPAPTIFPVALPAPIAQPLAPQVLTTPYDAALPAPGSLRRNQ